ncbi:MAG: peptidase U32 family protein [Flavobacteriales bacterium]
MKVELMSPAGSYEALMSAIKAGCDSIYFGIEQLNMRARSSNNFTLEDLKKISAIGHEHNVKMYLTLNTILYQHDMNLMRTIVQAAKDDGINAVIASDFAVMQFAKQIGIPVHISTQANVTNVETVAFFASFADVVVLSRELSLKQVAEISREIERQQIKGPSGNLVRLEIFAHGALCMAVSGKCYLSLHSHFSSANRGACIQNCRHTYLVTDKEDGTEYELDNEYIMSAKDLCTIDFIDQIVDAGVSVLKIEGRGRAADYVYTSTQCYREAIDALGTPNFTPAAVEQWKERLSTVFNRGFWDGYYLGRKMGEWSKVPGSVASQKKLYIAKGLHYYDKIGVAEFDCEAYSLKVGDEIIITGPTTGYIETKVESIHVNNGPTEEVSKGQVFSIPLAEKIRPTDKLYKIVPA